jgi:hypothetical protein
MTPSETLKLQALKLKQLNTRGTSLPGALLDEAIRQNPEIKTQLRNICALISPELFDKVENLANVLDLSKREFVEMALIEFVQHSENVLAEIDPFSAE